MLSITKGKRIVIILLICVLAIFAAISLSHKYRGEVLYHNLEQITPFHMIETTTYDFGNDFTTTEIVETQNTVISVRHSDKHLFSEEQWNVILSGIEDGSISWKD